MKTKMKDREGLMLLSLTLAVVAKDGTDEEVAQAIEGSKHWISLAQKYGATVVELYNETTATETA